MRTISQDDYLLARGANPRTGIVTPGHSLQSSVDDQETYQARVAAGESKWRQKGDQWISLRLDEPTPAGSPPKLDLAASLQHQIPRKPIGSPARRGVHDRGRSSSAPTSPKFKYLRPSDVGNSLETAPQKPFLGYLRAAEVAKNLNRGLRCPLTNSIPSLSPLSNQTRLRTPKTSHLPNQKPKPNDPGGGDPSYPCLRYQKPQIPPRHYHLIQYLQANPRAIGPRKPIRHEKDIQIVHPPFQPPSLRGRISHPPDMAAQDRSRHQRYATKDIFTIPPSTISMTTDTRTPLSTSNERSQSERKPGETSSLTMSLTRLWGSPHPQMPDRCGGMTDVPKVNPRGTDRHQVSLTRMDDGATDPGPIPRQQLNLIRMSDGAIDPERVPSPVKLNKRDCRVGSFEDKLCNMPGSILTFDGPAEAEVDIDDDTASSLTRLSSDSSQRTFTIKRAASYENCVIDFEGAATACLEPLLVALIGRLLEMGSYIIQTLGNILYVSYVYSERGTMKIEGTLVLDVLRSIVYTLILVAIAIALARILWLAARVGTLFVWLLKGVFWVVRWI
jgi:hypothetical protein